MGLTHCTGRGESLAGMGIPFSGEDHYNRLVLIHEGVPTEAIHVLEPRIVNTADEIKVVAAALGRESNRTVIFVTTKAHTRRVRPLCRTPLPCHGRAHLRA